MTATALTPRCPPDAGEHDRQAPADSGRDERRGKRCAGRGGLHHAVGGDRQGQISRGGSKDAARGRGRPAETDAREAPPLPGSSASPRLTSTCSQIAREAEAAIYHRQLFEELRRVAPLSRDPTEVTAIGAVEASFKCCAAAIVVLSKSGR